MRRAIPFTALILLAAFVLSGFSSQEIVVGRRRATSAATPTLVNSGTAAGTTGSNSLSASAFSSSLTNPSFIIVAFVDVQNTGASYTASDTAGNTYVDCGPGKLLYASSARIVQCFYALNTHTTASNVVKVTISAGTLNFARMVAGEFTNVATSSPIDGGSGQGYSSKAASTCGTAGANNCTATSMTTNTNGDLIVSIGATTQAQPSAGTSPVSYTSVGVGGTTILMEYAIQSSAGAIQPTMGSSFTNDDWCNISVGAKHN